MTTIEQKRVEYLTSKHAGEEKYTAEKIEFLVRTGLTFDPTTKKKFNGEEKPYKDIDWYYPKGAAFKTSEDSGSDEPTPDPEPTPEPEPDPTDGGTYNTDDINPNTAVSSSDAEGNTQSGTLGNEEPKILEGDDNKGIGTNSGEQIILNNEPSSVDPQEEP